LADRGEVARWRHTDRLPALELSLRAAGKHGGYPEQPAHVLVSPHPVRMEGITDPAELRQIAWCLLAAAAWLERQHPAQPEPAEPAEPDPQMTVFDFVEATP
jgi:hypothetical protein